MTRDLPSFVRTPADSLHPVIDREVLARLLAGAPPPAENRELRVMGPYEFYTLEQLRTTHGFPSGAEVPADFFLWGEGESAHRATTKLGGVPYLPADVPWPEREGTTGDFYGQLSFVDSKELIPELPGDVLLVFRFHDLDYSSWDEELYECRWVDVVEQKLIDADQVRYSRNGARSPEPVMHAYRVRSWDDPSQVERVRRDKAIRGELHHAKVAKIGGVASDMQSIGTPSVPDDWRFLGQLIAVFPPVGRPYPVVGREAPVPDYPAHDYERFCSGPGDGITCFYLDAAGDVRVFFSGA